MNRQAWRDFFITAFFLGIAFIIALLSSIAAERNQALQAAIAAAISLLLALLGALYIIPRLARNVRLEILRFAVRTSVTVEGLLFIVFLAVIAFAAWNTGNNLLYLVFSAMMAFLIAANLIARMSLADISVQLRFPDHIFAGEPANITVTIINHKRLMPSYSMMVEALADEIGPQDDEEEQKDEPKPKRARSEPPSQKYEVGKLAYFVLAPARTSARLRVEHTFERRGRYPITGFRISTKFPAGFFKKWRRIDASGEILVYPKPQGLDDFYHALPMLAGRIQSHARGSGDDLYAIRRYNPSDHLRNIDWKATAKSTDLMVREHMREDEWRLTIVFDTARPESADDDKFEAKFERAIVMAASLANHFILERADVELITPDDQRNVASGSGYEHLYKILRSLATLEPAVVAGDDASDQANKGASKWSLLGRLGRGSRAGYAEDVGQGRDRSGAGQASGIAWRLLDSLPVLADDRRFKVLITPAAKGTIPASIWRSAHVVFMDD
ncbi:MAG TPA: DUF58 domain-containing protein, partial [Blastocatellia bacterium]|nr:DUF58 domain-containing protein [Blastocatellia bacterium]